MENRLNLKYVEEDFHLFLMEDDLNFWEMEGRLN